MTGWFDGFLSRHVETILSVPGSKLYRRFVRATVDVAATQAGVLDEMVRYSEGTVFGREHGFDRIRGWEDFRARVPVRDYEGFRPYVDRHARGEEGVLFPGKPMMYNRSSGTTALPKLIPVSKFNFERTIKDRGKLWLYGLSMHYPGIFKGKDLTLVSPAVEGHTEDGTPFGSLSGLVYQNIPEFMKLVHTIPYSAITIPDHDAKVYTLLRFSVNSDVTVILTGNPATVLNLAVKADLLKEDLIRDISDGTLEKSLDIPAAIRSETEALLAPDPARAAVLEGFASKAGALRPVDYWPGLKLLHTWKNGNCRLVIPKLRPWFGDAVPIMDFGYIASEITATDLMDPATDGSILQVRSGFYEFAPYEDSADPGDRFLLAHELEVGGRYWIYVSTFSGLFRYDMNDVVEVIGKFGTAPIIRFLFKGKGVTSMQGEKLSEAQFIEAVGRASRETSIQHDFFVGYADCESSRYLLYIEIAGDRSPERAAELGKAVDRALAEVNVEYEAKRKSDRLGQVVVIPAGPDFFDRYRRLRLSEGAHDGQIKWLNLSATSADGTRLRSLCGSPGSKECR